MVSFQSRRIVLLAVAPAIISCIVWLMIFCSSSNNNNKNITVTGFQIIDCGCRSTGSKSCYVGVLRQNYQRQRRSSSYFKLQAKHCAKSTTSSRTDFPDNQSMVDRRTAILQKSLFDTTKTISLWVSGSAVVTGLADPSSVLLPANAAATTFDSSTTAETTTTTTKNSIINQLLDELRTIPTFCIVSNATGAAYMIYKRDLNMGIGYAFLTYDGAVTVLEEAKANALQKGYSETWRNATITTIPLDVAVRLTLKKRTRVAVNNKGDDKKVQSLDTLLQLIPGADERYDGMAIDKQRFQDQGRVPLFYVVNDNNNESSNSSNEKRRTAFYLSRKDLVRRWTQQQGESTLPTIGAIDLVGIFESLLLGRTVETKIGGSTFIPTPEFVGNPQAMDIAKEMKNGKVQPLTPYNPNQMIL